jgi:biopolymer transport protein ExbD
MRAPVIRDHGSLEFNMTPMIDVTFLLIIFFLVSSHLAQQEMQVELDLPSATSGHAASDEQSRRVIVNVLADGSVLLGSQLVDRDELTRRIKFESEQTQQSSQELEVRIRCDRRVLYRFIEPIMLSCAKSGVWKVTFAVVNQDGAG